MKRFDEKGVSPVVATILLVALTVAAVGIVAVILSKIGVSTPPPAASFGTPNVYVGGSRRDPTDNSVVINIPVISGSLNMMELKVFATMSVAKWMGGSRDQVTYSAQFANDGVQSAATIAPPAPAPPLPPDGSVYVLYYGTPVRTAGDRLNFFFQVDNTKYTGPTSDLLATETGGQVTVKLIHVPSDTTIYEATIMTSPKPW